MTKISLNIAKRLVSGRKVKALRRQGLVPGNIFGKGISSISIQIPDKELSKTFQEAGETAIIYATVEGEKDTRPLLISALQVHPVTNSLLHVDFHQVDLKEKVTAAVPIVLIGESPAVVDNGAVLVQSMDEIEVEALPTDLPSEIELDITSLKEFNDSLHVADLKIDTSKLKLQSEPEEVVVLVQEPQQEEVEEPAAEASQGEAEETKEQAPAEAEASEKKEE